MQSANISLRSTDRPKRSPNHLCTYNVQKGQSKLNKKKKNLCAKVGPRWRDPKNKQPTAA